MPGGKHFPKNSWKCDRAANIIWLCLFCVSQVKVTTMSLMGGRGGGAVSTKQRDTGQESSQSGRWEKVKTSLQV